MRTTLIISALFVSAVCLSPESTASDADVNEQFEKAKRISLEQAQSPEAKEYFGTMAKFWAKNLNNSKSNCQGLSGGGVEIILTINEQGGIDEVIGSPWNRKSRCYAKIVSGKNTFPPPVHPFFASTVLP